MGNPYKIKRHNRIYRRSAKSIVMRIAVAAVTVGLLFGIGWILYSPVTDFISQQREKPTQEDLPTTEDTPATPDTPAENVPAKDAPYTQASDVQSAASDVLTGLTAFLPNELVRDKAAFEQTLADLKSQNYTSVMVGLKLIDGTVTYNLSYQSNTDSAVRAQSAFDLKAVCDKITAAGLQPVASVHVFRDHLYPMADKSASTKYMDANFLWMDDSPSRGGKPWLNPFADSSQAYIRKLVDDSIAAGFKGIVLESVQFPVGYSLDKINYGSYSAADKQQFLKGYLSEMTSYAAKNNVLLTAAFPVTAILGGNTDPYFGDVSLILGETAVLEFTPSLFGESFITDRVSIPTPAADPYNTIKTSSGASAAQLPQTRLIGLIDGSGLTMDEMSAQIKGISESGISSIIVENFPTE